MAVKFDVEFKPNKIHNSMYYEVEHGSFCLDIYPYLYETCRERFARQWNENTDGFYFKHPENKGDSVAAFLRKTEIILKQEHYSNFAKTNRDTVLWIEPSKFWKSCRMRRSLFTILIRAGMNYNPSIDDYEQSLFSYKWAKATKIGIMRFLYGFTKYAGPKIDDKIGSLETRGWKFVFESQTEQSIIDFLKWPDDNPDCPKQRIKKIWT